MRLPISRETTVVNAAPRLKMRWVRRPAGWFRHSRSIPTIPPKRAESRSLKKMTPEPKSMVDLRTLHVLRSCGLAGRQRSLMPEGVHAGVLGG